MIEEHKMGSSLPLDGMSIEEKIKTMEEIWDDLVSHADSVPSPDWHKDILEDREKKLKEGVEEIIDWNIAKKSLKKDIE
jgi:hypothetical protein